VKDRFGGVRSLNDPSGSNSSGSSCIDSDRFGQAAPVTICGFLFPGLLRPSIEVFVCAVIVCLFWFGICARYITPKLVELYAANLTRHPGR